MKFTVIFPSSEASDATVGITFKSSLVWVEGSRDLLNPHPENPHYLKGDLRRFFEETNFDERFSNHTKKVSIVVHSIGNADNSDLENLVDDLKSEGFEPAIINQ